jgi:hypothetical protein
MVCPFNDELKLIVSPSTASATAWRSEPEPLSFVFITVNVAPRRLGKPTAPILSNAIRRIIRVCSIDVFLSFLDFYVVTSEPASFLAAAQMCFCPVKRKSRLKPARFFHRMPPGSTIWLSVYPQPILTALKREESWFQRSLDSVRDDERHAAGL